MEGYLDSGRRGVAKFWRGFFGLVAFFGILAGLPEEVRAQQHRDSGSPVIQGGGSSREMAAPAWLQRLGEATGHLERRERFPGYVDSARSKLPGLPGRAPAGEAGDEPSQQEGGGTGRAIQDATGEYEAGFSDPGRGGGGETVRATLWTEAPVLAPAPVPVAPPRGEALSQAEAGAPPAMKSSRPSSKWAMRKTMPKPIQVAAAGPAATPREGAWVPDMQRKPGRLGAFLRDCHALARSGLSYKFGSNNPRSGGMDCSGTVQYLLQEQDVSSVPRQSNLQYAWLEKKGTLKKVGLFRSRDRVLNDLKPGDLLFWKDTYETNRRPNVTHVMVYLGWDPRTGKHKMFGARGSKAQGEHGNAVDVFDFRYPFSQGKGKLIAYGSVPELRAWFGIPNYLRFSFNDLRLGSV